MKLWMIKRMSEKRIKRWIEGINILLKAYIQHDEIELCPFCRTTQFGGGRNCDSCLWKIFENIYCISYAYSRGYDGKELCAKGFSFVRNSESWHKLRIPMLREWKKVLRNELKRREK